MKAKSKGNLHAITIGIVAVLVATPTRRFDYDAEVAVFRERGEADITTLALWASIGIMKGKPFAPAQRMKGAWIDDATIAELSLTTVRHRPANPTTIPAAPSRTAAA